MRVLVVTGVVQPKQCALWRACRDAGIEITLAGADRSRVARECWEFNFYGEDAIPDLNSVVLPTITLNPKKCRLWWLYRGMLALIRRDRPHLIHVLSEPWGTLVQQALVAKGVYRSTHLSVHGAETIYDQGATPEQLLRRLVLRAVFAGVDGFVSWNREGLSQATANGLRASVPTAVIPADVPDPSDYMPVGEAERRKLRRKFRLPEDGVIVGFLGRLVPEKGCDDLVAALKHLGEDSPFLAAWGGGPLASVVTGALEAGDVPGSYGGALDLSEVPDAIRCCDIVVVPSKAKPDSREQFGRVAVEAMLSGCAVIAYDSGALAEVVGEGAVLLEEGDVAGLSREIRRLSADAVARSHIGNKARARALERFHPRVLADDMIRYWQEVVRR